jgi:hypothetical protein
MGLFTVDSRGGRVPVIATPVPTADHKSKCLTVLDKALLARSTSEPAHRRLSDSRHDESNNLSASDIRKLGIDIGANRAAARVATSLRVVFRTKSRRGLPDVGIATAMARKIRRFSLYLWGFAPLAC